jgi:hypothetical protein
MATVNVSLQSGLIQLTINTTANNVAIQNTDTDRAGLFNVFNAAVLNGQPAGSVIVWSYRQAPSSSSTIAIPTTDNNGAAIAWQVGNVTPKGGGTAVQTVVSPPWQLTMV